MGYAYFSREAIDLNCLCRDFRLLLISNLQIFKANVRKSQKKAISQVLQVLNERWLSKKYQLHCDITDDEQKDLTDCFNLLGDGNYFYSICLYQSQLPMISKLRPTKVTVIKVEDISLLFKYLPTSVTILKLDVSKQCIYNQDECQTPRKFKKLTLYGFKQALNILIKDATATGCLTIDSRCLNEPGVIDYLAQMDCKQIIVIFNRDTKLSILCNLQACGQIPGRCP